MFLLLGSLPRWFHPWVPTVLPVGITDLVLHTPSSAVNQPLLWLPHSLFPDSIRNAVEGLSLKISGLSAVPSVQDNHRMMPKGVSLPKSVILLDQSFLWWRKPRPGMALPQRSQQLQRDFGQNNKQKKQGEDKLLIYAMLENKTLP